MTCFVCYFFFENPFARFDEIACATIIAAIAVWLALHDIYPVDVSRKSVGWALTALGSAVMTTVFLVKAPVWELWSSPGAWISIAAGFCLGLLVSASALPVSFGVAVKKISHVFVRPMSQWYVLALALGLLLCTLGGVWVGIMAPFVFWALAIAGLVSINRLPQHLAFGIGLFMLFLFSGGLAIALRFTD